MKALELLKDFENRLDASDDIQCQQAEGNQSARVVEIQGDLTRKMLPVVLRADDAGSK